MFNFEGPQVMVVAVVVGLLFLIGFLSQRSNRGAGQSSSTPDAVKSKPSEKKKASTEKKSTSTTDVDVDDDDWDF